MKLAYPLKARRSETTLELTPEIIFEKALARYERDAERFGRPPEKPLASADASVDMQNRLVKLQGRDGELARYSFIQTVNGRIRFRPEWAEAPAAPAPLSNLTPHFAAP